MNLKCALESTGRPDSDLFRLRPDELLQVMSTAVTNTLRTMGQASVIRAPRSYDVITDLAGSNDDVARLLAHTRADLDRYLARVESD